MLTLLECLMGTLYGAAIALLITIALMLVRFLFDPTLDRFVDQLPKGIIAAALFLVFYFIAHLIHGWV